MGTTLTGTTPQDTYDSLIKVTDNAPLTGSLKKLTDGLGNDSSLSLSTTAASLSGTLAVTGNATFDTNTLFVDAAANRVGIGTATPSVLLDVEGNSAAVRVAEVGGAQARISAGGASAFVGTYSNHPLLILTNSGEKMRIEAAGNVGIGTSAPAVPLDVVGNIRTSTGILFGSDTAAANALDDYEEGTWTIGVSFGGASVAVTTSGNTGTYTKIGRQVTVNGRLSLTSKGSSSGAAAITGLPFTIPNSESNRGVASLRFADTSFANQFQSFAIINSTTIRLEEITEAGTASSMDESNFTNSSNIMISFTYFV